MDKTLPQTDSGTIYFVEREGFVKIGYTTDLSARLKALRKGGHNPDGMTVGPVQLLATMPGTLEDERHLHQQFIANRLPRTEWFYPSQELRALIRIAASNEVGTLPMWPQRPSRPKREPVAATPAAASGRIGHLVGGAEIGKLFGVGRQRVFQLTSRDDFPKPVVELAMGKVWRTEDVRQWGVEHGRQLHEDEDGPCPKRPESPDSP